MKIGNYTFFEKVEDKVSTKSDNRSILKTFLEEQKFRFREDLRTLELAIMDRDNIRNYNRELIHRVYRKVMQDGHISSQWTTRKLKTLKKDFSVLPEGSAEPNDDLTELLRKPWFYDFIDASLDSLAWGYTLMEFGAWDGEAFQPYRMPKSDKIHEDLLVVERDNVKPEYARVVQTPGMIDGVDFTEDKFKRSIIFIGNSDNGWLYDAAKPYLIKDNTLKNWSEFAELFGMDVRVFKTEAQGEDLKKAKNGLKGAVGGGSMVMGHDDSLEYIGTGRSDAYNVFKQLVDSQDSTLSKLIFGQDVISNNTGQVIGQVGENVSNMYAEHDARFVKYCIEDKLFPLLAANGVPTEGMRFEWDSKEQLSLTERADIDLKITQMGFSHNDEYINDTYDVNVEEEIEEENTTRKQLEALYNVTRSANNTIS